MADKWYNSNLATGIGVGIACLGIGLGIGGCAKGLGGNGFDTESTKRAKYEFQVEGARYAAEQSKSEAEAELYRLQRVQIEAGLRK